MFFKIIIKYFFFYLKNIFTVKNIFKKVLLNEQEILEIFLKIIIKYVIIYKKARFIYDTNKGDFSINK